MTLNIIRKPVKKFPVNPRVRAYGKARLDMVSRIHSPADWEKLWKKPTYPFPFTWGAYWNQCIEYKVDDFAAEVGFYTDILGLPVNALDPGYAMFTSPGGDFFIAIVPTPEGTRSTPPDAIRIQFMVADLFDTTRELEHRGISFEQWPQPCAVGSSLYIGYFRTPHGICVDLWGLVGVTNSPDPEMTPDALTPHDLENPQVLPEPDDEETEEIDVEVDLEEKDRQLPSDHGDDGTQGTAMESDELLEVEYVDEDGL